MEIPMYTPTSALRSELLHRLAEVNAYPALLEPFGPADLDQMIRDAIQLQGRTGSFDCD